MSAHAPPLTDRAAFLDAVRATDVLTPHQFKKAQTLAPTGSATETATALVAAEFLTRFQADRLLAGRTDGFLLGPYVILEPIGRGALSRVYKAKHRTMNRPVAIKVLSSRLTRTPAEREYLQREVRAAGKLTHPNIVTAYDANRLHDRFYLVLEYIDGPSLDAFVRQRGPLPITEACEFVRQAAAGLQHAHEMGTVHRALEPHNLLIARPTPGAPLTVKIADFGIPKVARGSTDFTAPELTSPHPVDDPRADLYSLGCVFHFLLTGRAPGAGVAPIEQLRPDVPPAVVAILHRLLAPPAARLASAAELLTHLDAACVPAAIPVDETNFNLSMEPVRPGHDSGYLTGRGPRSGGHQPLSGAPAPLTPTVPLSPWEHLTDEPAEDTTTHGLSDTPEPTPPPHKPKPPGHGEPVPLWMTAALLVGVVLLCLMGIGVVMKLAK